MLFNNMTTDVCNSVFQTTALHTICLFFRKRISRKFVNSMSACFSEQSNSISKSNANKINDKHTTLRNQLRSKRVLRNTDRKMRWRNRHVPISGCNIIFQEILAKLYKSSTRSNKDSFTWNYKTHHSLKLQTLQTKH